MYGTSSGSICPCTDLGSRVWNLESYLCILYIRVPKYWVRPPQPSLLNLKKDLRCIFLYFWHTWDTSRFTIWNSCHNLIQDNNVFPPSTVGHLYSNIVFQIMMKFFFYAFCYCAIMTTALPVGDAIAATRAQEESIPSSMALRGKWPYTTNM